MGSQRVRHNLATKQHNIFDGPLFSLLPQLSEMCGFLSEMVHVECLAWYVTQSTLSALTVTEIMLPGLKNACSCRLSSQSCSNNN